MSFRYLACRDDARVKARSRCAKRNENELHKETLARGESVNRDRGREGVTGRGGSRLAIARRQQRLRRSSFRTRRARSQAAGWQCQCEGIWRPLRPADDHEASQPHLNAHHSSPAAAAVPNKARTEKRNRPAASLATARGTQQPRATPGRRKRDDARRRHASLRCGGTQITTTF